MLWTKLRLEDSRKCCPVMESKDCMSVALWDWIVACETFHPKKGRLLDDGQIPPQGHTLVWNGTSCRTFTFLKPHFRPARSVTSRRARVGHGSAMTEWQNSWNARIRAKWKEREGKKRKVDTPRCNVRCWPLQEMIQRWRKKGLWWHHATFFLPMLNVFSCRSSKQNKACLSRLRLI